MTKIESLELELAARKMVEGTGLDWWEVVRHYRTGDSFSKDLCFSCDISNYELALGIIEGKPVWEDSNLYAQGIPVRVKQVFGEKFILLDGTRIHKGVLTWNPPKPKTVMAELTIDVATEASRWHALGCHAAIGNACRKALEKMK